MFYVLDFNTHTFKSCDSHVSAKDEIHRILAQTDATNEQVEVIHAWAPDIQHCADDFLRKCHEGFFCDM